MKENDKINAEFRILYTMSEKKIEIQQQIKMLQEALNDEKKTRKKAKKITLIKSEEKPIFNARELIEEYKKIQMIVDTASVLISEINIKGYFTYANPLFLKTIGYSMEELKKIHSSKFIKESHLAKVYAFYKNLFDNKIPEGINEIPVVTKEGEIVWVEQNVKFNFKPNGYLQNIITVGRNITKQKIAEIALKKSNENKVIIEKELVKKQEKFKLIVENVSVLIYESNYQGYFTYANPSIVKMTGYSLEELKKMHYLELIEENHKDKLLAFYQNQITQKRSNAYIEHPIVSKKGKIHWIGQNVNFIFKSNGQIKNVITIGREITKQKIAEVALKKSKENKAIIEKELIKEQEKLQMIVKTASALISESDGKGYFNYVNPEGIKLTGYSLEELKKMNFLDLVEESYKGKALVFFKNILEQKKSKNYIEFPVHTKEGSIVWLGQNLTYSFNSDGSLQSVITVGRDITKQKLAEIALKKSEENKSLFQKKLIEEQIKYKLIVDNASVLISESDYKGDFSYVNPAAIKKLGYSFEEITTMNFMDFVEHSHKKRVQVFYKNQITQRIKDSYIELLALTKKGEEIWFGQNVQFVFNSKRQVEKIITIGIDITSEKKQAELIQQQKKQLDIIVDNSTFGIALVKQNKIMKCNGAFHKLLGYTENEMTELTIDKVSHPEDVKEYESMITKMESGKGDNYTSQRRFIQKDGMIVWTKTKVEAVRSVNGNLSYHLVFIEDITKEREDTLKEKVINDIAKAILGKINTYDIAWEIVNRIANYLGSSDCVIYLYQSKTNSLEQIAAYGKKVNQKQVINKLSLQVGTGIVGHVAKTRKAEIIKDTSKDKRYIVDDNNRFSEIVVPIISKGKIIGVIDSEHNDRNYFTPKHLETLSEIAKIVSNELENAMIRDLKNKAEEENIILLNELEKSNIELQEYAHVVSHDLKSPLRSLDALINWIKEDNYDKFDAQSMKNFNLIELTLENMEQLISDVLNYSSVVSDTSNQESVDLNQIVKSIIEDFQSSSNASIKIQNHLPVLKGEKTRLKQLFQNLISNAVKFSDKKKGVVLIDYLNNKTHHKFSVNDNGIGIQKKYFDKIFELFNSLNKTKGSTGIGLSIVKKIVKFHNGDIWLESEIGIGTTFHFTIKK